MRLQIQRAEDLLASERPHLALPILARVLRDDSLNRVAAERFVNLLNQRSFLIPSAPPTNLPALGDPQRIFREARNSSGALVAWVTNVQSIDIRSGETPVLVRRVEAAHSNVIRSVSLSPDGARLVSASADEIVKIWNTRSGTLLATLAHPAPVHFAEFSPNGLLIATVCSDGVIRLWDAASGGLMGQTVAQHAPLNVVRFSPDGLTLAAGGVERVVRLWRVQDQQPISEPLVMANVIDDFRFAPDGRQLFVRLEGDEMRCLTMTHPAQFITGAAVPPIATPTLTPIESVLGRPATNFHRGLITCTNPCTAA